MRVCVPGLFVYVLVNVRFGYTISRVGMLMVLIMLVAMGVNQAFMLMVVGMRFGQYQPGCDCHSVPSRVAVERKPWRVSLGPGQEEGAA